MQVHTQGTLDGFAHPCTVPHISVHSGIEAQQTRRVLFMSVTFKNNVHKYLNMLFCQIRFAVSLHTLNTHTRT